jgi:hypothetical protein
VNIQYKYNVSRAKVFSSEIGEQCIGFINKIRYENARVVDVKLDINYPKVNVAISLAFCAWKEIGERSIGFIRYENARVVDENINVENC